MAATSPTHSPDFERALLAGLLALACGPSEGSEGTSTPGGGETARPRNLLLISLDTLRPDHLGCYGHVRDTSPTLDALAARGARFADVTAAAPWTLPSHATMLTGLYPSTHGVKDHETRLADAHVTLAEELAARGLRTLAVVNTFNVGAPQFQLAQGFQEFHYEPPRALQADSNRGREVVAKARQFLADVGPEQPFFLFLHFYDAHTDLTPRPPYRAMFVEPYDGELTGRTQELVALRRSGETVGEDDLRWLRQMYDAEIRQLDDLLGRFLEWMDGRGLLAETLVAVTSDHGEEFQEHGSFLHGRTYYQEVLRIPLILAGPGVPAGVVVEEPVHGVDVVPTLLARLGVESSVPRDGLDLSPLLAGGALSERVLFGEADHLNEVDGEEVLDVKRMARRGDEKLLVDRITGAMTLHDLAEDPLELRDLAAERAECVAELAAALAEFDAAGKRGEAIPGPTQEELELLEALGYGGGDDD